MPKWRGLAHGASFLLSKAWENRDTIVNAVSSIAGLLATTDDEDL